MLVLPLKVGGWGADGTVFHKGKEKKTLPNNMFYVIMSFKANFSYFGYLSKCRKLCVLFMFPLWAVGCWVKTNILKSENKDNCHPAFTLFPSNIIHSLALASLLYRISFQLDRDL